MTVAVIGAGLAGLTAARALADAGRRVVVFEKSRGLGGRLATRRTSEGWRFNHGAPEMTAPDAGVSGAGVDGPDARRADSGRPDGDRGVSADAGRGGPGADRPRAASDAFAAFCAGAEAAGHLRRTPTGWAGVPGASAAVAGLARGLDIRFGVEVEPLLRAAGGWRVADETFAAVVCAAPAPQTARLCAAGAPRVAAAAASAMMDPCWTLMSVWRDAPAPVAGAPFAAVIADAAEGGAGHGARRVAHASAGWSRANLERPREEVAADLAARLAALCGADPAGLLFAQGHRWRFARVAVPVGEAAVAQDGVVAAGDWLLGPDAAHAHASGLAAAAALR